MSKISHVFETFCLMLPCPLSYLGEPCDGRGVYPKSFVAYAESPFGSAEIIYSPEDNSPYEITVRAKDGSGSYRWVQPEYAGIRSEIIGDQYQTRVPSYLISNEVWHEAGSTDDILAKISKILRGVPHDDRCIVSLKLRGEDADLILTLAKKDGLTIEEFIELLVQQYLENNHLHRL